jgi:quercetin dioxygenase-like cupin family protein
MLTRRGLTGCALCALAGFVAEAVNAQTAPPTASSGIKRTILQRVDGPAAGYVTVMVSAEIPAGFTVGRHTHPGIESAFTVEGGGVLSVDGLPDRAAMAGEAFQVPASTPHSFKNADKMTRLAITYVVERDKPLASPA